MERERYCLRARTQSDYKFLEVVPVPDHIKPRDPRRYRLHFHDPQGNMLSIPVTRRQAIEEWRKWRDSYQAYEVAYPSQLAPRR